MRRSACRPIMRGLGPSKPAVTECPFMNKPDLCPACGAANDCSLADPRTVDRACWCYGVSIDPAVLQALPAELRDKSCLCPACAQVEMQLQAAAWPIT